METNGTRDELAEQLREIERGQAAPWISYPPVPRWWAPGFGLWTATYTLTIALADGWVRPVLQLLHLLVMLGLVVWMRRVRGTYPRGRSPRELRGPLVALFAGALVVALAVALVCSLAGAWVGAALGFVLAWALVAAYEKAYARACDRVRERLA